jgi:hypothetical protein
VVNGKILPKNVIDRWPEVFGEITCNVVPIHYLTTITITFKNGKVWEIVVDDKKDDTWDFLESQVKEIVGQYETAIENVDFQLDTDRIKKDIIKHTKKFLKTKKLK